MSIVADPMRWVLAAALLLTYVLMCAKIAQGHRRRTAQPVSVNGVQPWLVAFASQTGTAEELAMQTANSLRLAGIPVQTCTLSELNAERLGRAERALFIASTYGEGDAPDNAARFCNVMMRKALQLERLHYAVLALGDNSYTQFCRFGRMLDGWLQKQGAHALFKRIDVNRGDKAAIDIWRQQLTHLVGTSDAPDWDAPAFNDWVLTERRLLNPGSAGAPVYHLELEPLDAVMPSWESGDLAQVQVPEDPDRPREYSIASLPADRRVHLLVRLHRRDDGTTGLASGRFVQMPLGGHVKMRVRAHRRFRLGENAGRPLILIGNGTGIAGLRGHLKACAAQDMTMNWLLFGERNSAIDFHYREEIDAWQAAGKLARVDAAFSRDQEERRYVQDRLLEADDVLREWVERGAAIYVCGSLKGMAEGVDAALAKILGKNVLDSLTLAGRYRRDVY